MLVQVTRLSNMEAVQLVKDITSNHAYGATKSYLDTKPTRHYANQIGHQWISFECCEMSISLAMFLYSKSQKCQGRRRCIWWQITKLSSKVIIIKPGLKDEVIEVLKTQLAYNSHNPYSSAMVCTLLNTKATEMSFIGFRMEYILMIWSKTKHCKVSLTSNTVGYLIAPV